MLGLRACSQTFSTTLFSVKFVWQTRHFADANHFGSRV